MYLGGRIANNVPSQLHTSSFDGSIFHDFCRLCMNVLTVISSASPSLDMTLMGIQ